MAAKGPDKLKFKSYRDLIAWQKAMDLAEEMYGHSGFLPEAERFGLTSQLRRAVVSVPSNIAEGLARSTKNEFVKHLRIALGSLAEAETQFLLAIRLKYLPREEMRETWGLFQEVGKTIGGLIRSLQRKASL
ncbi:MAG: hypothetical protein BIFFINMI_03039 [Phycisphaerae bacterium]|nr:hypothetical protein [Phycisphaerae bacterium]